MKKYLLTIWVLIFYSTISCASSSGSDVDKEMAGLEKRSNDSNQTLPLENQTTEEALSMVLNEIESIEDKKKLTEILKSILEDDELLAFASELYTRLKDVNPYRLEYEIGEEEQALDAFARLLVGDETCAAVAFDGEHLLIATNEKDHQKDKILYSLKTTLDRDLMVRAECDRVHLSPCYNCQPIMRVSVNDGPFVNVTSSSNVFYNACLFKEGEGIWSLKCVTDSDKVEFLIPPEDHHITGLPFDVKVKSYLEKEITIIKDLMLEEIPQQISIEEIPQQISIRVPPDGNISGYINPLRRRVQCMIEHLFCVIHVNDPTVDSQLREEWQQTAASNRERVLRQSLAWEAAKWYHCAEDLRDYLDAGKKKFKDKIDDFLERLNQDFLCFKAKKNNTETTPLLVKEWFDDVFTRIKNGQFEKPIFMKNNDSFKKFASRYFVDLEYLETYFVKNYRDEKKLAMLVPELHPVFIHYKV